MEISEKSSEQDRDDSKIIIPRVVKSSGKEICLYCSENVTKATLLFMHIADPEEAACIWRHMDKEGLVIAVIKNIDWNRDLSPWKAERAFPKGEDFKGGAESYLQELTTTIIPSIQDALKTEQHMDIGKIGILGYSLGGMFALYAAVCSDTFSLVGSVSGSLWYDDFITFLGMRQLSHRVKKVYLSLGTKENHVRDKRMRQVLDCTKTAEKWVAEQEITVVLEENKGNHFYQPAERMVKAVRWLLQ